MIEWFLSLPPLVIILIVSLLISVVSLLIYKLVTDQKKLKSLQDEQKKLREEIKKHKDNPKEMMKFQKRSMEIMNEMLPQTFKSMMITFIPIVLIFTWLGAHIAYEPILPNEVFTSTIVFENDVPGSAEIDASEGVTIISSKVQEINDKKVLWELKSGEGRHTLYYVYGDESYTLDVLISENREYLTSKLEKQKKVFFIFPVGDGIPDDSNVESISVDLEPIRPFGNINFFGWHPGWLGTYIIFSFLFSTILRKVLKVH